MGNERVLSSSDEAARRADPALLGGKGANLAALAAAGLPVPPWVAVTTRVFEEVRARVPVGVTEDVTDPAQARAASERITRAFLVAGLSADDRERLLASFDATLGRDARVAVRSSAVGEDAAQDSFAGQLDTFLNVGRDDLEEHVLRCMASAWSERALLYRKLRGLPEGAAAVVVQRLVESRVSGVLFTANPTTGDRAECVVTAGLGLGEGVVADKVETDTFFADLETGALRRSEVQTKTVRIVRDARGTRTEPVPATEGTRPALTEEEVRALVAMGRRAQDARGGPQDVEWAIGPGGTWLLQTRPITTLAGRASVFDASNIAESYPGLSLPLTYSFARHAYEQTFRESSRTFGVPEDVLAANRSVHANLIALVDGRIYYDLLNFYGLFQLVPGFEGVLPAWEKALGLEPGMVPKARPMPWHRAVPAKLRIVRRVVWHFARLTRNVRALEERFAAVHRAFHEAPLATLDAHALVALHEQLCEAVLAPYAISVVNDFFAQQLYELLGKLIARYGLGDPNALRNDLLCGEKGMESVEPVRSLLDLAARIRRDPAMRAVFDDGRSDAAVHEAMQRDPAFAELRPVLARHLERYGDRTVHELKLETPTLADDPAFLVRSLRSYLLGGQDVESMEARERAIRDEAERVVAEKLAGRPLRGALFRFVLANVRKTVRCRENLRLLRSRAFGMVKRIFRALGRLLAARGLVADAADVFYLTVEEVVATVRGGSVTRDLRALVALRKAEYAALEEAPPPPLRVVTRGIAHLPVGAPLPPPLRGGSDGGAGGMTLQGLGCSPGAVTAPAKVVLDPRGGVVVRGEVLVAPSTDPGWVFLMVAAKGIVVERGSMLSHTAIIGRELGIPTIVGVKGATTAIPDGAQVTLDGRAGTVALA